MKRPKPRPDATPSARILERVRRFVSVLPAVEERLSRDTPVFCVGGRQFAMVVDDHHGAASAGVWTKAPEGLQADFVHTDPVRFFVPPYLGSRGWIGIRIDARAEWKVVDGLLFDAFLMTAPARVVKSLVGAKDGDAEKAAAFVRIRAKALGTQE